VTSHFKFDRESGEIKWIKRRREIPQIKMFKQIF